MSGLAISQSRIPIGQHFRFPQDRGWRRMVAAKQQGACPNFLTVWTVGKEVSAW